MDKKNFFIGKYKIKEYNRVFIIAEAGVNHNQSLDLALKLVDAASWAGADAVKFQTFKAEQVVTQEGKMADYQKRNIGKIQSQREMLKGLELSEDFYPQIIKRCLLKKILFMSTPHGGRESVDFLEKCKVPAYKISSGDLTNYLLLERVAKTRKPVILSSGMATLTEIRDALRFISSHGNDKIAVLHCTSNYPCLESEINLLAMVTMMRKLNISIGYSDHSQGIQTALMAATLGMAIYEGHITLDKNLPGPDHIASADPQEFKARVEAIRKTLVILGSAKKSPTPSEISLMAPIVRKSLVAAHDLEAESTLKINDLEAKRPGNGISAKYYEKFLGKKLKLSVKADRQLSLRDVYG